MNDSSNKYYVKKSRQSQYSDITSLFDGVAVLKLEGMLNKGKAVNIYTAQWIDTQEEDFAIGTLDEHDNPIVVRENGNVSLTFIIRQKYAVSTIDIQQTHENFVNYMTTSDVWLKTNYLGGLEAHCVCLDEYEPTTVSLNRGDKSYIIGTMTFHMLDKAFSD